MTDHADGRKNIEIEVLRGVAILLVLYAHTGSLIFFNDQAYLASTLFLQGGPGVDLFFAVSGYVITRSFIKSGHIGLGWENFHRVAIPFWIRRFWRLVPTAWVWVLVVLVLSIIYNKNGGYNEPWNVVKDGLAILFQVANFHFYECMNQINATTCGGLTLYWSLAVEEQFYLLFPFIMFAIPRRFLLPFFAAVVLVQFFIPRHMADLLWFIRTDAIAFGVIIALLQEGKDYNMTMPRFLRGAFSKWAWFIILLLLLAAVDARSVHFVEFTAGLVSLVSAILVWTASFNAGLIPSSGRFRNFTTYIGSRSYALYIVHLPAVGLVMETSFRIFGTEQSLSRQIVALLVYPLMLGFAEINYRYLENPLRLRGKQIAGRFAKPQIGAESRPVLAPQK